MAGIGQDGALDFEEDKIVFKKYVAVVRNFYVLPSKQWLTSCKDKVCMEWEIFIFCPPTSDRKYFF